MRRSSLLAICPPFRWNDKRDASNRAEAIWRPGHTVALSVYAGRRAQYALQLLVVPKPPSRDELAVHPTDLSLSRGEAPETLRQSGAPLAATNVKTAGSVCKRRDAVRLGRKEGLQPRANERPAVGCSEKLAARRIRGQPECNTEGSIQLRDLVGRESSNVVSKDGL